MLPSSINKTKGFIPVLWSNQKHTKYERKILRYSKSPKKLGFFWNLILQNKKFEEIATEKNFRIFILTQVYPEQYFSEFDAATLLAWSKSMSSKPGNGEE